MIDSDKRIASHYECECNSPYPVARQVWLSSGRCTWTPPPRPHPFTFRQWSTFDQVVIWLHFVHNLAFCQTDVMQHAMLHVHALIDREVIVSNCCHWMARHRQGRNSSIGGIIITLSELGWKNKSCYITICEVVTPMMPKTTTKTHSI